MQIYLQGLGDRRGDPAVINFPEKVRDWRGPIEEGHGYSSKREILSTYSRSARHDNPALTCEGRRSCAITGLAISFCSRRAARFLLINLARARTRALRHRRE